MSITVDPVSIALCEFFQSHERMTKSVITQAVDSKHFFESYLVTLKTLNIAITQAQAKAVVRMNGRDSELDAIFAYTNKLFHRTTSELDLLVQETTKTDG